MALPGHAGVWTQVWPPPAGWPPGLSHRLLCSWLGWWGLCWLQLWLCLPRGAQSTDGGWWDCPSPVWWAAVSDSGWAQDHRWQRQHFVLPQTIYSQQLLFSCPLPEWGRLVLGGLRRRKCLGIFRLNEILEETTVCTKWKLPMEPNWSFFFCCSCLFIYLFFNWHKTHGLKSIHQDHCLTFLHCCADFRGGWFGPSSLFWGCPLPVRWHLPPCSTCFPPANLGEKLLKSHNSSWKTFSW